MLIQVSDGKERSDLLSVRLPEYLIALYEYDTQDSTTDVFHEIGINRSVYRGVVWFDCDCTSSYSGWHLI